MLLEKSYNKYSSSFSFFDLQRAWTSSDTMLEFLIIPEQYGENNTPLLTQRINDRDLQDKTFLPISLTKLKTITKCLPQWRDSQNMIKTATNAMHQKNFSLSLSKYMLLCSLFPHCYANYKSYSIHRLSSFLAFIWRTY